MEHNALSKDFVRLLLKAFTIAFIINFLVYLPELAQMPLGDHDLGYLPGIAYTSGGGIGRWFLPFLYAVRGFELIPVVITLLAFVMHIGAGMAAVYLWYKEKANLLEYVAGALFISLIPFSMDHYFFHWQADSFPFAQLCMILAIIFSSTGKRNYFILGVILTTIGLATYQSSIQTAAVCWTGVVILQLIKWDGSKNKLLELIRTLIPSSCALLLGALLYFLSVTILRMLNLIRSSAYQLEVNDLSFAERIFSVISQSFLQFWYSQPFFPKSLKILLLGIVLSGCIVIIYRAVTDKKNTNTHVKTLLVATSLAAMLVLSQIQSFIVTFSPYTFRLLATSLSYIYLFAFLILLLSQNKILQRFSYVLGIIILLSFVVQDLKAQYYFAQQNKYDFSLVNRVIYRVESLDNFDPDKEYTFILLGKAPIFNELEFKDAEMYGASLAGNTITKSYPQGLVFPLLTPYIRTKNMLGEHSILTPELIKAAEMSISRRPYPARESCFIHDDLIVVILDNKAAQYVLKRNSAKTK